jgi:hypothetical protein
MKIEVSIGEVVDKLSILSIKLKKIKDEDKLKNIRKEYDILKSSMEENGIQVESDQFKELESTNLILWDIEDRIRVKESRKEFDEDFIELARKVYFSNDKRSEIKREINIKYGSDLIEEKEYVKYDD